MFRRKKPTGDLNPSAAGNPDQAVEDIESALRTPLEPPRVPATPIAQPFSYGAAPMSLNRAEPPKPDARRPAEPRGLPDLDALLAGSADIARGHAPEAVALVIVPAATEEPAVLL
jgi:hypothetical protein